MASNRVLRTKNGKVVYRTINPKKMDKEDDSLSENEARQILKQISTAEMLIEDDTAIAIKIALPGNNFYEYWVEKNSFVLELLEKERRLISKSVKEDRV